MKLKIPSRLITNSEHSQRFWMELVLKRLKISVIVQHELRESQQFLLPAGVALDFVLICLVPLWCALSACCDGAGQFDE